MSEKQCLNESGYMPELDIKREEKTLLAARQLGSFDKERQVLLLLERDYLGTEDAFGRKLLQEFLAAAAAAESLPQSVVLVDTAVKLACTGNEALGSLCRMEAMGADIFVCRLSAERHDCDRNLCCGTPAGVKTLWSVLLAADKIIAL